MWKYITKRLVHGIIFGIGVIIVLGTYIWVQAIEPGKVIIPFFGPQDDHITTTILASEGKVCQRYGEGDYRDYLLVPDNWTIQNCHDWAYDNKHGGPPQYRIGCVLPESVYSFTNKAGATAGGTASLAPPSPNCGW